MRAAGDKLAATTIFLGSILKAFIEAPLYNPFINHQLYGMYGGLDSTLALIFSINIE